MTTPKPEDMRAAMVDYVRTVHQSYLSQARLHPPAVRGRMPLLGGDFTVIAAGVGNLHVLATRELLARPQGPEVAVEDELETLRWSVRFYDPVVLPQLGLIDESRGPASGEVRRALGITTYLYHLIVQPGAELTAHHAGHAGSGLANAHVADARDYQAIRAHAAGKEALIDEMEGAARSGLTRAVALLAAAIVPGDAAVRELATRSTPDAAKLRRAVLDAVRSLP